MVIRSRKPVQPWQSYHWSGTLDRRSPTEVVT